MKIVYTVSLALVALLGASTSSVAQDVGNDADWNTDAMETGADADYTFDGAADYDMEYVAGVVEPNGGATEVGADADAGVKVEVEAVSIAAEAEDLGLETADDEVGADADMDFATEHIFGDGLVRQNMISAVNKKRLEAGLPELCMNYKLLNTAQSQAYYMARTNLITITSEDGFSPSQRGRSARFNSTGVAEIIGAGYTKADDFINSWLESPSAKAILLGNYTHIGPGYTVNATQSYVYYWVVDFAHGFGEPCSNLTLYSEN